jgi:hypothetical protein
VDITQVLPLVLEHGDMTCPAAVCSLLLLSKPVKEALESQCECKVPACLEVRVLVKRESLGTTVSGFAHWLAQHSHLVRKLTLVSSPVLLADLKEEKNIYTAAETMISLAFSSAAAAALNGLPPGLDTFEGDPDCSCAPAMLSSLPARSLKSLKLDMAITQLAAPSLPGIFQRFSNLQTLVLRVAGPGEVELPQMPAGFCTDTLSGLSNLKYLELEACSCIFPSLGGLPVSIETLRLRAYGAKCLLDIQHLTSLQTLHVEADEGIVEGSSLPQSLLTATFEDTPMPADGHSLLPALQGLQDLRLHYPDILSAAGGAAVWGSLPHLRTLQVQDDLEGEADDVECQAVLEGMARATSLTSVVLCLSSSRSGLPCGVHIAQLQNLQELVLKHARSSRQDMLHLRELTQLTSLKLMYCSIDDATTAEVLGSLTGLKSLVLVQSNLVQPQQLRIVTDAIVPVIKYQLKGLRDLELHLPGVNEGSVGLLEGLTQLTKLKVGGLSEHSVERLRQVLVGCKVTK